MNRKLEVKVFWQDNRLGKETIFDFCHAVGSFFPGVGFKVNVSEEKPLVKIPDGFDLYIIHIGDLEGDDFKHLKERHSKCRVVGVDNGGDYQHKGISTDYVHFFDKIYSSRVYFNPGELKEELALTIEAINVGKI